MAPNFEAAFMKIKENVLQVLNELPEGVELDLVPLEDAWPELVERVRTEGVLLNVAA